MTKISTWIMITLMTLAGALVGWAAAYFVGQKSVSKKVEEARGFAAQTIENARRETETKRREVELENKARALQARTEFEKEFQKRRNELNARERRLSQREE
ncbi:MAG TPA: Rnase Y domain-containing protein, partial [Nitrospiria bacterium]|nr:Rnase Y domain-containing protein [Nitrospiria bacterium]